MAWLVGDRAEALVTQGLGVQLMGLWEGLPSLPSESCTQALLGLQAAGTVPPPHPRLSRR